MDQPAAAPTKAEPPPPQDLVKARKQLTRQQDKEELTKNCRGIRNSIADQAEFKNNLKNCRADYKQPEARPSPRRPESLPTTTTKIADITAELQQKAAELKAINKELPKVDARIQELEGFKKQYEGSAPWTAVKIGDPNFSKDQQAFVGEIEMSLGAQGRHGPDGQDDSRRANADSPGLRCGACQAGRTGPGSTACSASPSATKPNSGSAKPRNRNQGQARGRSADIRRGTVGELKTLAGGERQLSDVWNKARVDKFGLSATEAKAVKEAYGKKLKNGEDAVKRFYALTDSEGTRFFEVHSVSATEVVIGEQIFF